MTIASGGAVTFSQVPVFPDNTIETADIQADAITAAKIADDAISEEHLDVTAVTGHTAETSAADGDLVVIHDASASALRKMTVANLVANAGGGKILQVVSTNKTDTFSVAVANDATLSSTISGFTVAITPSATNSKILILSTGTYCMSAVGAIGLYLFRDTTQINLGDANETRFRVSTGMSYIAETGYAKAISMVHVDSPNTTSEVVYSHKMSHTSGTSKTMYLNRDYGYGNNTDNPTSSSNIIAIEIGA
jgi:hypothetical protein